jgi:uncharacterized membrane protein
MADRSPYPDVDVDTGDDAGRTPRWVVVFGIVALVAVLLVVVLLLAGGHGPGRHAP